jgi:hypothetical protein
MGVRKMSVKGCQAVRVRGCQDVLVQSAPKFGASLLTRSQFKNSRNQAQLSLFTKERATAAPCVAVDILNRFA